MRKSKCLNSRSALILLIVPVFLMAVQCTTITEPEEQDLVEQMSFESTTVRDHSHTFIALKSEIEFPIPGGISRNSSLSESHVHAVTLTQSQLLLLKQGGELVVEDSPLGGHGHTYTMKKWYR